MSTATADRVQMWPLVALHFGTVTNRGEQLRRARELRRLSRRELAALTKVSEKTIARIEKGAVGDSRNIDILEEALAPELARLGSNADTDGQQPPLDMATDLDLITTLAGRLSEYGRRIRELEAEIRRLVGSEPDGREDDDAEQRTRPGPPGGIPMHFRAAEAPSALRLNGGTDAAQGD